MARIHDITAEQRALAVSLRREFKYSYRNIALKTNMSKTSVQRVIKRFNTKNTNTKNLKKSYQVRRKSLTERNERKLKRAIIQLPEKSPNLTVMEYCSKSRRFAYLYSNTYRCRIT